MMLEPRDEKNLREYLLGRLDEASAAELEERLLFDDNLQEYLAMTEAELIDDFVAQRFTARDLADFKRNFKSTPTRQAQLRLSRLLFHKAQESAPGPLVVPPRPGLLDQLQAWVSAKVWYLATPAIIIILILGVVYFLRYQENDLLAQGRQELISLMPVSPFDSQVAAFATQPTQATERGDTHLPALSNEATERIIAYLKTAEKGKQAYLSQYYLGILYLRQQQYPAALQKLQQALATAPSPNEKARILNDIGVINMEAAMNLTASQGPAKDNFFAQMNESLKSFKEALALAPSLTVARFNRALCYYRLEMLTNAKDDWKIYLEQDSTSRWADKARSYLQEIDKKTSRQGKRTDSSPNSSVLATTLKDNCETSEAAPSEAEGQLTTPHPLVAEFIHLGQAANWQRDADTTWRFSCQQKEILSGNALWLLITQNLLQAESPDQVKSLQYAIQYLGEVEAARLSDRWISELANCYENTSLKIALSAARQLFMTANSLFKKGNYAAAEKAYDQARKAFTQSGNQPEALLCTFYLGFCKMQAGDLSTAHSIFTALVKRTRDRQFMWLEAQTWNVLGMLAEKQDNISQAIASCETALQVAPQDPYIRQKNRAQMAHLAYRLGDYETSLSHLQACLQEVRTNWSGPRQMWRNYGALVQTLVAVHLSEIALGYAREEATLIPAIGPAAYISYLNLAQLASQQGNAEEASLFVQKGLCLARKLSPKETENRDVAYANLVYGHLLRQAGQPQQAVEKYQTALTIMANLHGNWEAWQYEAHKGKLLSYRMQGETIPAQQEELAKLLELLTKYRAQISTEHTRNVFFDQEQEIYDTALDVSFSLHQPQQSFRHAEESRARSLLMALHQTARDKPVEVLPKARPFLVPPTLAELQEKMSDHVQIVEYAVVANKVFAFIVSAHGFWANSWDIDPQEINEQLAKSVYARPEPADAITARLPTIQAQASKLYLHLIRPIEPYLDRTKLLCIIPDKFLNHVAFNALLNPDTGKYLLQDFTVFIAPSATIYQDCTERIRSATVSPQDRLLVLGGPAFQQKSQELPAAEKEAQAIAALYPQRPGISPICLTREQAVKPTLLQALPLAQVIHLATHYQVNELSYGKSRLLLAQSQKDEEGDLSTEEISRLSLQRSRLAVLSACQSGVEGYYKGEGMRGLARAFLVAGTPQVVASLWPVNSDTTSQLMLNFHRRLTQAQNLPVVALRQAQLEFLQTPAFQAPYYWATFTLIGGSI